MKASEDVSDNSLTADYKNQKQFNEFAQSQRSVVEKGQSFHNPIKTTSPKPFKIS